jgi:hypothetical protein
MKRIIIAILLSFFMPGFGQIYNKENKRGLILILASFLVFLFPMILILMQAVPKLPDPRLGPPSQDVVQSVIMEIIKGNAHFLNIASFVFLGIWAYSITQAYFKAKELKKITN